MINIFPTKKLESFFKISDEAVNLYNQGFNANVFFVDRKKCILFTHKKTYYSFLILNIQKKDIENFDILFYEALNKQFDNDKFFKKDSKYYLNNFLNSIQFHRTDNDKKAIGNMNSTLWRLKDCINDDRRVWGVNFGSDKPKRALYYAKYFLNQMPIQMLKYDEAHEAMKAEIKSLRENKVSQVSIS